MLRFNFWTSSPFIELSKVLRITISSLCCPLKIVLRLVVLKRSAFLTHRSQQISKASFSLFHSFLPWMFMKKILCTRNGAEIRAFRKCLGSSCPASHVSCASKVPSNLRVVTEARHSFWSHALRRKLSHRTEIIANENPQCLWTALRPWDMGWYLRSALATFCTT